MPEGKKFSGLVFVKQGRIGTKSEGPDYYLQTRTKEYVLNHEREFLYKPEYFLEFFCRKMVEVTGIQVGNEIKVSNIKEICQALIPSE